jgi:dipeptidyl aminopeptidase/acylaminoacyl peptidase
MVSLSALSFRAALTATGGLLLALTPAHAQTAPPAPRAMALRDWYRVTTVSQPAVSPDGKRVAFTVTTVRESENKRHQEVWVASIDGGAPQRWTSPGYESSAPRWTPDGTHLLFTSTRPPAKGNTWALRADLPGGEAMQVPTVPSQGSVSRSGKFAVWAEAMPQDSSAGTDAFTKMPLLARPPFDAITQPADPTRFDGRHFVDMVFKSNDRGFVPSRRTARTWRPMQLWSQPYGDTTKTQLTRAAYSHRAPSVSPDGRWIAFVADARLRPDSVVDLERDSLGKLPYDRVRDEAERNDVDVFVMPVTGGTPRKVADWMGAESDLEWSPDGRQLAFIGRPARAKSSRIYVVDVQGGAPRNLLGTWQYEPETITWLTNGTIRFTAAIGGRTAILDADLRGVAAPREIVGGRRRISGLSVAPDNSVMAWVGTSMTRPTELFITTGTGTNERQLTHFNDALNAEVAWSDAERFTYRSVGDLEIEGWLMKPYGYDASKKYPVVLYIHGGPHSAYGENWFDEFQNLAAQGMFVLFTNPRGSSGYGADFTYSTRGRWGIEDYDDLMKAVDIVARRPDVDATKIGASGGSYGGFMTTWMATKTQRFAAIQTDRTITDWTYWYGASDAQGLTEYEFYGKPWDNQALYDSLSPIRYVAKVRTPMLLVQSEEDFRTAMGSAEMWYTSLKKQGVPAELVRYPRSNHDLSRTGEPWLLVDRLGRLRQWFGYWLQGQKVAAPSRAAGVDARR